MAKRKKKPTIHNPYDIQDGDEVIKPCSEPQEQFIKSSAYECFYAGSAGAGKTFALALAAAKQVENPNYRAVLFRNTMGEVTRVLLEETNKIYPHMGATYNHRHNCWTFPSKAKIYLSYMNSEDHIKRWLGSEITFLGFDELVTFDESMFTGLIKRLRSSKSGTKRQVRATSNPFADWVFYRYNQWLDHKHTECVAKQEISGQPECSFSGKVMNVDGVVTQVIMGTVQDNIPLITASPEYVSILKSGSRSEVSKFYYNDWTVRPSEGLYFKREDFKLIEPLAIPADAKRIRGWDVAFTLKGDYTVGVRLAYKNGIYYVEDVIRVRQEGDSVVQLIKDTADADGRSCLISLPKEPGGAGKFLQTEVAKALNGYTFSFRSESVDRKAHQPSTTAKEAKALAFSAQVTAKNVRVCRNKWNADFLEELEDFPLGKFDDQVDAVCGAYNTSIGSVYIGYKAYGNIRPRTF